MPLTTAQIKSLLASSHSHTKTRSRATKFYITPQGKREPLTNQDVGKFTTTSHGNRRYITGDSNVIAYKA